MKVELIGLSQGISFENKQATNFLDFRKDTGELFRISVPQSVAEELLGIILAEDKKPAPKPAPLEIDREAFMRPEQGVTHPVDEDEPDGTVFGGDDDTSPVAPEPARTDEASVPSL